MNRHNIAFVLTDQQRADSVGAYGVSSATPTIDALAASGTRFDRWYTPTAICTPARTSLLTGAAPFRHKVLANPERNVGYIEELPEGSFTFSRALRSAGYNVGLVGKWHVGTTSKASDYGFDALDYRGWHNQLDHPDYLAWLDEHGYPPPATHDEIRASTPTGRPGPLLAARLDQPVEATFEHYLTSRAIEQAERYAAEFHSAGRPFFLALHFFGPHLPYIVPDEYFDLIDPASIELPRSVNETFAGKPPVQRNYSAHWGFDTLSPATSRLLFAVHQGYCALIDAEVARLLGALERLGLTGSTAVFFSSDHGEFTGAHRLHDKGPAMYEDIYRTAGIVRIPGGPPQARREFVSLLDCTATILDLAGIDPAEAIDSRSLVPLLRGEETPWASDLVCEFHGHHFPLPQRMIRHGRYKLVVNPESVNELYDLVLDPDELINVHELPELADVRRDLTGRLYARLRERGDNFHHWMMGMYDGAEPPDVVTDERTAP